MGNFGLYGINLKRRRDRWNFLAAQTRALGLDLHRVDAVDALDPKSARELEKISISGPTGILGVGAKACAHSHSRAWSQFLQSSHSHGVFLEDDACLSKDFDEVVRGLVRADPDVELIKLEGGKSSLSKLLLGPVLAEANGRNLRRCYQIAPNAAGYILNRKGAEQALARFGRRTLSIDHFLFYPIAHEGAANLSIAALEQPVVRQSEDAGSDIAPSRHKCRRTMRHLRRVPYELAPLPYILWHMIRGARVYPTPFVE